MNFYDQLLQVLKNRLLLADLLKRHPEINDIALRSPVVIAGLPRTGTTHLHNLLAAPRLSAPCRTGRASSRFYCRIRLLSNQIRVAPEWISRSECSTR
ncbi:sulfotransferase [Mycobacterium tilburgii]|uniref:sulfotransferase n=1 Tax=Mycobacterium tilburgii TaxID=44467 RepID=UPI0021B16FE7|nr:sulfotransferase [Mycobacterium tilburgii]